MNTTTEGKAKEILEYYGIKSGRYDTPYQALIAMSKWQAEQDKGLLDAKDESIVQLEMSMFERICHVCKYRCAKIGDTCKCANGKSFGEQCSKQNCPMIK